MLQLDYKIREAKANDAWSIVLLLQKFHKEAKPPGEFDARHMFNFINAQLNKDIVCILVLLYTNKIVGAAGFHEAFAPWNIEYLIGNELFWWIDREHRGTSGREMLKELEVQARKRKLDVLMMASLSSLEAEKMDAFYRSEGFKPLEQYYMKAFNEDK